MRGERGTRMTLWTWLARTILSLVRIIFGRRPTISEVEASGGHIVYIVQPGDTLWGIAQRYGTTVETLVELNHIQDPSLIVVGQELLIPTEEGPPPPPPPEQIAWTRKLTGFYGNRWQAWEHFVKGKVPGITWLEFKDQALVYNPQLEADGYIFRPEKEYLLPEISHEPSPPPPPPPPPPEEITWTRKLTGFYGNRWQAWEQFVKSQVPGITWHEFKDQVLVYNPHLETDGYVFRPEKEYLLPEISHEPPSPPPPPPIAQIKGLYMTYWATRHAGLRSHVLDLLETTELNAVVIDIKSSEGFLYDTFTQPDISNAELLTGALSNEAAGYERADPGWIAEDRDFPTERYTEVTDFTTLMNWLKKYGIYTIARIVVFKDNKLVSQRPDLAVKDDRTGEPWRDYNGVGWTDPYLHEVWDYNVDIAVEAARRGFDEIQYDYVRWPTDGPTEHAQYAQPNTVENRAAAMGGFLALTLSRLEETGAKLAVDFFGYTCWRDYDTGIGQVIEGVAPHIDVLCPMLYPSTFGAGLPGYPQYNNAIAFPYEVVYMSAVRAVRRLKVVNPAATVRAWIQDFPDYAFDKRTYTPEEIREQMRGAIEAGCSGWMLWDPRVRYTREALLPAEEPPPSPPSPSIPTYPPNKMGQIVVLEYHNIGEPEGRWQRTPDNFRADLEYLLSQGYYPVNLIDVVRGNLNHVPRGRRPIVFTFDDSSGGQFRYLNDGSIDPDCAAGMLKAFHEAHPDDWPLRATFFVLLNADEPGTPLFRQGDTGPQKVRTLVGWGMEIGSHTINHLNLSKATLEQIRWELAVSQHRIEGLIPDHQVRCFAPPFGAYPEDLSLLKEGYCESEDLRYTYEAAVKVGGEPSPSPFSDSSDPYRIPRVQAFQDELDRWLGYFERYPERYYVSDGGEG